MLKRLIKYDMRAVSRIAVPMFIASGIISLLCCAVLYFTFGFAEEISSLFNAFMVTGGLYVIGVVTILVMLSAVLFTVVSRYYRSVFTDEGYLNMVIPVSKKSFLDAKIISSVIWFFIASVVSWICVVISLILPTLLYDTTLISSVFDAIKENLGITKDNVALGITTLLFKLLLSSLGVAKDVMLVIAAITLGAAFIKKFKIVSSIVLYFVISFSEELFTDAVSALVRFITVDHAWMTLVFDSLLELMIIATVFAAAYLLSLYTLEKRLNLE